MLPSEWFTSRSSLLSDDPAGSLQACTRKQGPNDFCPCSSRSRKPNSCDESLSGVEPWFSREGQPGVEEMAGPGGRFGVVGGREEDEGFATP